MELLDAEKMRRREEILTQTGLIDVCVIMKVFLFSSTTNAGITIPMSCGVFQDVESVPYSLTSGRIAVIVYNRAVEAIAGNTM